MFTERMDMFRRRLVDEGVDVALITDDDSVYYLTGYYDYLHMEFGRPTILVVTHQDGSLLITPNMEADMAEAAARVDRIAVWNDGLGMEWRQELPGVLVGAGRVAIEPDLMAPLVRNYVDTLVDGERLIDVTPVVGAMRMVKSPAELQLARHAGQVAGAMMDAGRAAIGAGVAEFEVALATSEAGTRKAAELLDAHYDDTCMSPNTHFLQIMASGGEITKPHHRASNRLMQWGEPVFLCLCGMTNFHRFKLGFDRTFWIGEVADDQQAEIYEVALASQTAALSTLRSGVTAESVHAAYAEVIHEAGFDYPFRCGRATGYSFLEKPELVSGDTTMLESGMVLAIDGSVSVAGTFRAQVGDSFIVKDDGYEQITHHLKDLNDVVIVS
ncbi:MAG: Xaa-Pro peptidase family protein [Acidimicrobiales bacterium]|mgnify:FL=1|jgi:Xaa-Pro aminopeptidase|nr:Xaa-Pro peptidase family protein [Acidimicrobiales bacterium]MDP7117078.1 Xaa-Pro peptidase family protein [Acidimicrobiales bacterium]MDP7208802.1 Xaa-Pro peptidase family protein [Acidimicrobiales bacterium]MDP7410297.1 Xaa-Pro peptidase family protein [Acidimicrobiales bacterium]|tara:strand:- start:115 stop:1269 length:1155 start_codon:yes stop_codon:yes gene_type:complete